LIANAIPSYSVKELNNAVGSLLERGFAPRFLVQGSASRPQVKKGHLWMNLTDGEATITVVCWASRLNQLDYVPADGDGITVVGKLIISGRHEPVSPYRPSTSARVSPPWSDALKQSKRCWHQKG